MPINYCIIVATVNKRIYPSLEWYTEMVFMYESNGRYHWSSKFHEAKKFNSQEEASECFNNNKAELLKYYNSDDFCAELTSISVLEIEGQGINYRNDINYLDDKNMG